MRMGNGSNEKEIENERLGDDDTRGTAFHYCFI